ncbi:hypothetical protein ABE096_23630 [Robertmurraya massiliosenegalensis]|uniref:hypothetical protein n=1 Tax=Robertmurraya TaxID=2837507 RepID=UPI0039A4A189
MKQEQSKNLFKDLLLFGFESKGTMGIYFSMFVFMYLVFGKISIGDSVVLDLWTAIQMVSACILIGFGQTIIMAKDSFHMYRSIAWLIWSSVVTIGFTLGFGWFDGFPLWSVIVFCSILVIGYSMLLLALFWQTEQETKKLNEHLKVYQERGKMS